MATTITHSIRDFIRQVAEVRHVRILYAAESGSRAWGFPSPDSDYDVRFIYLHPIEWYLTIQQRRDTIEAAGEGELIDGHGWDLRKALKLGYSSNVSLFEWLNSPIRYYEDEQLRRALYNTLLPYFSPRTAVHHYLGIAEGILRRELNGEEVRIKHYFYMLRPLLAARYVQRERIPPPVTLSELLDLLEDRQQREVVDELIAAKAEREHTSSIRRLPDFERYLHSGFRELRSRVDRLPGGATDPEPLDEFFQYLLVRRGK